MNKWTFPWLVFFPPCQLVKQSAAVEQRAAIWSWVSLQSLQALFKQTGGAAAFSSVGSALVAGRSSLLLIISVTAKLFALKLRWQSSGRRGHLMMTRGDLGPLTSYRSCSNVQTSAARPARRKRAEVCQFKREVFVRAPASEHSYSFSLG